MTTAALSSLDLSAYVQETASGEAHLTLAVENVQCAGCMSKIEREIGGMPGVHQARLNFTTRRLSLTWDAHQQSAAGLIKRLSDLGFPASPFDQGIGKSEGDQELRRLIMALAVSGFGMMNIMLLSISVWAGAVSDMDETTRSLFHWLSALIGLPVIAYAGRPFYLSAWRALKARSINMDVPISVGVITASGLSLSETMTNGHAVYFDSAVMLLFFLLIGRTLDHLMRRKVRAHAENLASLRADMATVVQGGDTRVIPASTVVPGMIVQVRPGERVPVDGQVVQGTSEVDRSLITGETVYEDVAVGAEVLAGTVNGSGLLQVRATAEADSTFLETVNRLLEAATQAKSRYVVLADRAARIYAPVVHLTALSTFLIWLAFGMDTHQAALIAVSVLIITCPCALGLAVPAVQAVASGYLFKHGILLNTSDAIERLAAVDTIVFDKTGTLTKPDASIFGLERVDDEALGVLIALARSSSHPLALALGKLDLVASADIDDAVEVKGSGVEALWNGERVRLGSATFCDARTEADHLAQKNPHVSLICGQVGGNRYVLGVGQMLREDAGETIEALKKAGYKLMLVSGDRAEPVEWVAQALGFENVIAGADPVAKTDLLNELKGQGRHPMMVGDGINDAAALATATVSLSPVSAADVSKAAADGFYLGERLRPVFTALRLGRAARAAMFQNIGAAVCYNIIAVPLAALGFVTPLVAALAMSGSSLVVTANALRLRWLDGFSRTPPVLAEPDQKVVQPPFLCH